MEVKTSVGFEDVSDEGSVASLETSSSLSIAAIDLPPEWEVALADDKGRLYYINNDNQATSWCPPFKSWKCCFGLPFGWEIGIDDKNYLYYINHESQTTSYKHPKYENKQFEGLQQALQAKRRKVVIKRHARDGFGFVAGSEKPVIIRSVVAGSPADGQLSANDQLFSINGQIAYNLPQPQVISMIRSCTDVLEMEVVATEDIQDVRNQGTLKSALMSRATRERRKSCPVSVRFEEKPEVVTLLAPNILSVNLIKQMIPNVLKIYLENGQTKSFQYNTETLVEEIFDSVIERLQIKESKHFALVLIGPYPNQCLFLQPEDRVTQIVNNKVFSRWECRLELSFIPNDAYELLSKDPVAFDYWYQQTSGSVVKGHFGSELKFDAVMRLAALQIHVAMTAENEDAKYTLKDVSKEYGGLDDFLPDGVIEAFKKKDIKKALSSQLKSLSRIALPGHKLTSLQAKLHYLKIASQSPVFGGRIISAHVLDNSTSSDSSVDFALDTADLLISPSKGICTLFSETGNVLQHLVDIPSITGMVVTSHTMNKHLLKLFVKDKKAISIILSPKDADDVTYLISRYYQIKAKNVADLPIYNLSQSIPRYKAPQGRKAPVYEGEHHVVRSKWSYIDDVVPTLWIGGTSHAEKDPLKYISVNADFSTGPPKYDSQSSYDRSSFVPLRPRPAVDSLIRELSIRDKKRRNFKKSISLTDAKGLSAKQIITSPGQFDTTHFGRGSALIEEDDQSRDSGSEKVVRHVITCSMSSDEESSDEEMNELARRINRSGTVAQYLRNKANKQEKAKTNEIKAVLSADDEDDSGWRTDTSSNTGSLGRSNPWGTFSEEDSSDKDSLKQLTDSDSLLSHRDEHIDPSDPTYVDKANSVEEVLTAQDSELLHQMIAISSLTKEEKLTPDGSPKHDTLKTNRNSFEKYLINQLPNNIESNNCNDNASEERPWLLRPLSQLSDDVFTGEGKSKREFDARDNVIVESPEEEVNSEFQSNEQVNVSSNPGDFHASETVSSPEGSLILDTNNGNITFDSDELRDLEERPKSVNLADLNIYIPGPPKETTRELSSHELIIPSPPFEFADAAETKFEFEFIEDQEDSTESDGSKLSFSSSSSEDVVEFMISADEIENVRDGGKADDSDDTSLGNEEDGDNDDDDDEVEFMNADDMNNARIYEQSKKEHMPNEQNNNDKMKSVDASEAYSMQSQNKGYNLNEKDTTQIQKEANLNINAIGGEILRRLSEPNIPPRTLPSSPSLELKRERIASPLFFSAENESRTLPRRDHLIQSHSDTESMHNEFESPQRLDKNQSTDHNRLKLPSTPLSLRRNQFHALNATINASQYNSFPNGVSFDLFNEYIDECKTAISKSSKLEEELSRLIDESKRLNRQSYVGDDPERQSYIDVMRTCARSLAKKTKDVVSLSTTGDIAALNGFVRSSQNEVQSIVVAIITLKNSTAIANLVKDVVVEYIEVVKCLRKSTGKPLTDPDVVQLVEKTNELSFSSSILVRGLRSN